MKYLIYTSIVIAFGCNNTKRDYANNENNPSSKFCENIKNKEECEQEGCLPFRTNFYFVDVGGNCIKKTTGGNICLHATLRTSNNDEPHNYYKSWSPEITIAMHTQSISFLDGWTELSGVGYMDYCCYRDNSSCEEPTEDITDQWYPFEGLFD